MSNQQRSARKRNRENDAKQQQSMDEHSAGSHEQNQQWSPTAEEPHNDEEMDEYSLKRLRNNAAVSRTRQKKRMEQANTSHRVKELREENAQLERSLDTMRRELALLKEMVVVCAAKGDDGREN